MNWLKMNLLVLVSSMLLTACAVGPEPDEFEEGASAEEETAEAEAALVEYGNHCEEGFCCTYKWECNGNVCTLTIL
jgi:hypothetical protein